jgi:tetratricopeptide (TPR) repeat protein
MGRLTSAVALLQQAVELDPKFALAWAELGDCHASLAFEEWDRTPARLAAARTAIETAKRLAPDDPGVLAKLGSYFYHADRDYVRASEQYVRLTILRPNDPEVLRALGRIHIRQGRWAEGAADLQHALNLDPGNLGEAGYLATVLTDGRRYAEAEALTRRLAAASPERLDVAAGLATIAFLARGSTTEIDVFLRRVVPPDVKAQGAFWRRFLARLRGDTQEAIRLDRESPYWEGAGPRWAQEAAAAVTLADAGDFVAARARATSALALMEVERPQQPASSWLFAWMGMAHALLGQKEAALANARHAMEILPESRDAVYGVENSMMLASVYAWVGEKDLALAEFARLLNTPHGANVLTAARGSISTSAPVSFRPLWDDPRFQALLADPANNQPLF